MVSLLKLKPPQFLEAKRSLKTVPVMKPLACGRYIFLTASLPKRLLNGRFTSETAVRLQKRNHHLYPEMVKKFRWASRKP